ncbi:MFS transporter [Agromyces sp. SYSU K20354]|uniref:MFS transporter n=1 Tax=Agromyces cavernae TaxID=2898659 RepID=UPI001E5AAA88|nr:MFS transporter [Agromyces cavernae]MCD2442999.1 MFS transporter [Agromyces cavernae]
MPHQDGAAEPRTARAPRTPRFSRSSWTIAALCSGTALSALNSGMIAVSLSTLRREFAVDAAAVTWVISVFYLTSAVLQPLMGRLADRYGPRRVFRIGMCIVIVAGVLGPFSPSLEWLCAARVVLAVGTATTFPSAASMLRSISAVSGRSAPKMIGRIQLIDTSTAAIGPIVGGVLLVLFGWEAIFWINVPLAAIAIVSTSILAPRDGTRDRLPLRTTLAESDIPGILAFSVTIVALLMFLLEVTTDPNWLLLPAAVLAAGLFVWRELRCAAPFIDLRLLAANVPLIRVYLTFILANLVLYSALFGMPQFLEDHAGFSTAAVGAMLVPLAAFNIVMTPVVERLIDRRGLRTALVIGSAGLAVATLGLLVLAVSTAAWVVLLVTAAIGIPYVVVLIAITQSLYVAAPPDEVGEAAGLFQTARSLGCIGSTVVVGVSFASGTGPIDWLLLAGTTVVLAVLVLVVIVFWRTRPSDG